MTIHLVIHDFIEDRDVESAWRSLGLATAHAARLSEDAFIASGPGRRVHDVYVVMSLVVSDGDDAPDGASALIMKWRADANEIDADGDVCCALTRRHDADELEDTLRGTR